MPERLLILGASVRAAAQSAAHAGYRVTAIDLFGDEDLRACAHEVIVVPREKYPHGLADAAERLSPSAWMYTGGLENYPDLIARVSQRHQLLGNGPEVLRGVRDPFRVVDVLRSAGLNYAPVCSLPREIPLGETWLKKPLRSSTGEHVRFVRPADTCDERTPHTHYYQCFQKGVAASAVYVAAGGRAALLGLSEQLLGKAWGARTPFMYAGSIGPLAPSAELQAKLERLGPVLAEQFHLVGLFGVDGVLTNHNFWPVEINPRYTASAEIHERSRGESLLAAHVAACTLGTLPILTSAYPDQCWGKAILYAPHDGTLPSHALQTLACECADIPAPGTSFRTGDPVLTLFASAPTNHESPVTDHVRSLLASHLHQASRLLQPGPSSQ